MLTEREIRTLEASPDDCAAYVQSLPVPTASTRDGRGQDRWLAVPVGARGSVHYPDLVLVTQEGLVAVEVEVTPKPRHRQAEIINAYKMHRIFYRVFYLSTTQVQMLLHGSYRAGGGWFDGALQATGTSPSGQPVDTRDDYVQVRSLRVRDEGVQYRLDLRQVPDAWWVSKSEWAALRAEWAADTHLGEPRGVPFLKWWRDLRTPTREAAAS